MEYQSSIKANERKKVNQNLINDKARSYFIEI